MPFISNTETLDWEDPDLVPRPVITLGADGVDMRVKGANNVLSINNCKESNFHQHRKGQFMLWMRGLLICEVAGGLWLVPPGSAIWVPGGLQHRMETSGFIECYVVYVDQDVSDALPRVCCTLSTTPLLRELVFRSAALPMRYPEGGMESRLMTLLLDEIALAQPGQIYLPLSTDKRLRKLVEWIMADPSNAGTIDFWAARINISARTLSRLVYKQTGMSFGRWRRQLHILLALQWMARGATVQDVADSLGYENASNFVVMFRKVLGETPIRYMKSKG